ncbi:MAG: glutathione synthase [Woeseiaceae bacterium]|nr:glutathione synthase [Woeseiaceae bacterium]
MAAKPLKIGIVMDPIDSIIPKKDSSFAMLLEAARRDAAIHYFEQRDLCLRDGTALGRSRELEVQDDHDAWFTLGEPRDIELGDLDAILMRKDPPFDMEYVYTTYILERAQRAGALIVNDPRALRDMNEKAYTAWFPECTPGTLITRSMADMKAFVAEHGRAVVKPLDGMGGRSIFVVKRGDNNANVIFETLTNYGTRFAMAQVFIPEISLGDKRILLIDGKPVPFALARIPSDDDNRGNIVAGATTKGQPLSERDVAICEQVGPALQAAGVLFAGIDVIGDYLTEINVTSPTGIRELDRLFELNIAATLFDAIEDALA